jgi:glucosamine--fructose-6-phosphate aminotransferase (isomerizing)
MAEKAGFKHFMQKEIYEQPRAITDTLRGKYSLEKGKIFLPELMHLEKSLTSVRRIHIVACGTSWHAGLIGKFLIEKLAHIPVEVDIASEYRYRDMILDSDVLFLAITQSGETADTLAALRMAKNSGCTTISICNVVGSTAARESDGVIFTHAGPEIGVASTKAFTTQVTSLYMLGIFMGQLNGFFTKTERSKHINNLIKIPEQMESILTKDAEIEEIAKKYKDYSNFLFLGRHFNYPVALEGALKLKEISYIHAEGYPAGEMKHGPIALIDENMPVFTIATHSRVYDKMASNIEEIKARDGIVIATVTENDKTLIDKCDSVVTIPHVTEEVSIFLNSVITQFFAYHCARLLGNDVDQPRNLAKSVTVE